MDQDRKRDWRELCKAAAIELDPAKLMNLLTELTRALDERDTQQQIDGTNPAGEGMSASAFQRKPALG